MKTFTAEKLLQRLMLKCLEERRCTEDEKGEKTPAQDVSRCFVVL